MRIAVTGAGGRIGRAVVQTLLDHGSEVVSIDRVPTQRTQQSGIVVDLCDYGQTAGALAGVDAVIHLAAIPAPVGLPQEVVYRNNVLTDFNVFEAAALLGIRRVVYASSISAFGFAYHHRWFAPQYLPIDEAHPLLPQDCYALSKTNGENVAAAYCRRGAGSAASLRFSTVIPLAQYPGFVKSMQADPEAGSLAYWSYTDLRDAAEACRLAATVEFEGHHPLHITADDSLSELPTDQLFDTYFPNVPRRPGTRSEQWSAFDCTRAAELLGFHARYHWRDAMAELQEAPEQKER